MLQKMVESPDRPKPGAWGEKLKFAELRPNEEIAIRSEMNYCRGGLTCQNFFVTGDEPSRFKTFKHSARTTSDSKPEEIAMPLTPAQAQGLDLALQLLRTLPPEGSPGWRAQTYSYFRGGQKIGEEVFLGSWLLDEITRRKIDKAYPLTADDRYNLSKQYGISLEVIDQLITPAMLAASEPEIAAGDGAPKTTTSQ